VSKTLFLRALIGNARIRDASSGYSRKRHLKGRWVGFEPATSWTYCQIFPQTPPSFKGPILIPFLLRFFKKERCKKKKQALKKQYEPGKTWEKISPAGII